VKAATFPESQSGERALVLLTVDPASNRTERLFLRRRIERIKSMPLSTEQIKKILHARRL
jgi:hypothetical protein